MQNHVIHSDYYGNKLNPASLRASRVIIYWAAIIDDLTRATQINEIENKTDNNKNGRVC